MANVIRHAYRGAGSRPIRVTADVRPAGLRAGAADGYNSRLGQWIQPIIASRASATRARQAASGWSACGNSWIPPSSRPNPTACC